MKTYLAIPNCGWVEQEVVKTITNASRNPLTFCTRPSSMLTDNFNELWCEFMNKDYTHFAMLHADISAENYWVDKLLTIMEEKQADIVSVVMPIKDNTGDTSTAFLPDGETKVRRLTLKEIRGLPETFCASDVGLGTLLVNTGLWLAKKGEWCQKFKGFHAISEVYMEEKWKARRISEDWLFSMEAKELGAKIYANRSISATHIGRQGWRNFIEA